MKLIVGITLSLALGMINSFSATAEAAAPVTMKRVTSKKRCDAVITKVEFRSDLTRVYATLNGIPHTSFRIDKVVLITPAKKSYQFTDIDGIDAKRYFQWEDDGIIKIEIDFPAMNNCQQFTLEFYGPDNEKVTTLYKKAVTKKTQKKKK